MVRPPHQHDRSRTLLYCEKTLAAGATAGGTTHQCNQRLVQVQLRQRDTLLVHVNDLEGTEHLELGYSRLTSDTQPHRRHVLCRQRLCLFLAKVLANGLVDLEGGRETGDATVSCHWRGKERHFDIFYKPSVIDQNLSLNSLTFCLNTSRLCLVRFVHSAHVQFR